MPIPLTTLQKPLDWRGLIVNPFRCMNWMSMMSTTTFFTRGVIYHVTDPVLSLRILFNALKDGGRIFVETMGVVAGANSPPLAAVEGPRLPAEAAGKI